MFQFTMGFVDLKNEERTLHTVQVEFPRRYLIDFIMGLLEETTPEEYEKLRDMGMC